MNNIEKKRAKNRVFGFCQVLTLEKKFLGHTLDLNIQGIKIVVPKEFSQES